LDLLQGDDLAGRRGGDAKDLAQERGFPYGGEGENIASHRGLEDGVPDIRRPARLIAAEVERAWIRAGLYKDLACFGGRHAKHIGEGKGGPVREGDALEPAREALARAVGELER
jgi:hypothetical protein